MGGQARLLMALAASLVAGLVAWMGGANLPVALLLAAAVGGPVLLWLLDRRINPANPAFEPMPHVPGTSLAALARSFPLPLVLLDRREMVTDVSQSARDMFPALVVGRPLSLIIRDPDFVAVLGRTLRSGDAGSLTLENIPEPGEALKVYITRFGQEANPRVAVVFEDLTEPRALERMRVDFVANASHELRTPLASLIGFVETLQGPARNDVVARERFLAIMREQAGRMARVIDDLLSLSRAEMRAHQAPSATIDLGVIAREIVDSLGLSARERGVTLECDTPGQPVLVVGDRDDLLRLLENLAENAIKYGRDGGRVELRVTQDGAGPLLSVRDYGPGIEPEHIPRLTERFYRVDVSRSREVGGTGLGLAIVKHIAARHRARLDIASEPGKGATFSVRFPKPAAAGKPEL
jgi:two-component system phosphate regulon sensor histidine kinase PhoR